jgi:hypothetical protein
LTRCGARLFPQAMDPRPPIRSPHFFDDGDGPATLGAAQGLLFLLCSFARRSAVWRDRHGREVSVTVARETDRTAVITLTGALSGHIELSIDPSFWVRADFHRDNAWFGRGWIERCYEECEIWPDGADGIVGPRVEDDPPGRISKRGAWIQFDTTQWPGYESADRWIGYEIPED